MTKVAPTRGGSHARALAVILEEEFGEPFRFHDPVTGAVVHPDDGEGVPLDDAAAIAAEGRATVTPLSNGYRLAIPLYGSGRPILVAVGVIPALQSHGAEASRERRRIEKWTQSVCDRLRCTDHLVAQRRKEQDESARAKTAWEVVLTLDNLMRHLRVQKNSTMNQQRILQAAFGLMDCQAILWVPSEASGSVVSAGDAELADVDCRQLAAMISRDPTLRSGKPLICNEVRMLSGGARFPHLTNLVAFVVTDQQPLGWVIVFNKRAGKNQHHDSDEVTPFRNSDLALLTPFVGLLELQARTARRFQDLKDLLVGLTRSLTSALDAKDAYTQGHSERVGRIAVELGRVLGMGEDELGNVYLAGLLHDIGKIGINDAVLSKPTALTPEEYEHIKQHVTIGHAILADLTQLKDLLPGVLYHHEKFDGTGYPEGLAGTEIPLLARILAVADSYDAMSTTRAYRTAMPAQRVEQILVEGAGTQWDKHIIDAFLRCREVIHGIRQRGIGESLRHALDGALHHRDSATVGITAVADRSS